MSPDVIRLLIDLLSRQQLSAADPQLVDTARMVAQARTELAEALEQTETHELS